MNPLNKGKITKTQFLIVKRENRSIYSSSSGYDLNENGGIVADRKFKNK